MSPAEGVGDLPEEIKNELQRGGPAGEVQPGAWGVVCGTGGIRKGDQVNAKDHFEAAEALLLSCQVPGSIGEKPEQYPAKEDDADSVSHAIAAAQVHATLALAAVMGPVDVTITPPATSGIVDNILRAQQTMRRP
jgi:hypothetical protein